MKRNMLQKVNGGNSGVTLILALLILATVTVVSFSIGALTLREIRASRQLTHSEPAIIAAEAGGETVLFFRARELSEFNEPCPIDSSSGSLPSSAPYGSTFETCTNYYSDPYEFTTVAGNEEVIELVNPINLSDDRAGYSSVVIRNTQSSSGAALMRADLYDLVNPSSCPIQRTITVGGSPHTISGLNPNTSYAIFLYPCASPGTPPTCSGGGSSIPQCPSGTVSGEIDGSASITQGTFSGIPSKSPLIESIGGRQGLERKLEIELNEASP